MKKIPKPGKTHSPSAAELIRRRVPAVLIPGLLAALALGWNGGALRTIQNWYDTKTVFPAEGVVASVDDGDTLKLTSGRTVRLLGVNAPERGKDGYASAAAELSRLTLGERVYLEYDRYQDDKFGRILAWVWTGCELLPKFLPADYMHLSKNASKPGLTTNPRGCSNGHLINELLVREGVSTPVSYSDRGELKYEQRLRDAASTDK